MRTICYSLLRSLTSIAIISSNYHSRQHPCLSCRAEYLWAVGFRICLVTLPVFLNVSSCRITYFVQCYRISHSREKGFKSPINVTSIFWTYLVDLTGDDPVSYYYQHISSTSQLIPSLQVISRNSQILYDLRINDSYRLTGFLLPTPPV